MTGPQQEPLSIARKVYRLHTALVRRVNDTHIFAAQALKVLRDAQGGMLSISREGKDRRYDVPSIRKSKFARRTPHEVRQIYDRFLVRELYENFIVSAVSQLESFLFETLRLVLLAYPQKLKVNIKGVEIDRTVSLDVLLGKEDIRAVLEEIVENRILSISYANPRTYLQFLGKIAGIDIEDKAFEDYLEVKATRDLLIHNSGMVNAVYGVKAATRARARIGQVIQIDRQYFDRCIATIKRISGIVRRDVDKTFPDNSNASAANGQDGTGNTAAAI